MTRLRGRAGRVLRMVVVMALATVLAVPVAAWASHQFTDVSPSDTFHADIDWMADKGVTQGCNPPANDRFCPDDFVTREQMAAFMHRLETEGVFLPADAKAADAHRLDGMDSADLLPRFAAISMDTGTFKALDHRGLASATRFGTGRYMLVWAESIANCAWLGTAGPRDGVVLFNMSERTIQLSSGADTDDFTMYVRTFDENSEVDTSFSVAIHC